MRDYDYTDEYRRATRHSRDQYAMDRQQRLMVTIGVGAAVMLLLGVGIGFGVGRATAPKPKAQVVVQTVTETVPAVVATETPTATVEETGTSAAATVAPAALTAPKQLAPSNGKRIDASRVTLKWSSVADPYGGSVTYAFQIETMSSSGAYGQSQIVSGLKTTSYSARVTTARRRWRVWAVDSQGKAGPKSGWWTYKHTYVAPSQSSTSTPSNNATQ